ncbi:MAG: ATP-binding protein, partial [Thermodesulfobacteriota bacterium]|nr:ATP-binding protein [Thermodesulfobacteriota bacterium]
LVVTLISLVLDRYYVARLMDERLSRQTDRVSRVLSNSEFVLNPVYLNKLQEVVGGDIVVFEKTGGVLVSTLSEKTSLDLAHTINVRQLFVSLQEKKESVIHRILNHDRFSTLMISRILFIPTHPQREMILCVLSPLSDVTDAKSRITIWMVMVGLCGLVLVGLVGYVISRSITQPIRDLVDITEDIADGHFEKKTPLPSVDELRRLASSINTMTDRLREYEGQIIRSTQMAAAGKVTAAMAHEIRNPLSSIKMMTQLLRDRVTTKPENYAIAESLLEEIFRLERIVRDLTDLAKPSELTVAPHDFTAILEETLPLIEPKLNHRKVQLIQTLNRSLSHTKVDKDRIKQVIWNIVLNAMESMPRGGTIKVSCYEDVETKMLNVVFEDEGHGITEEIGEKVFTPFFTTKPEGLGLGLSTSKDIIESHGGSLKFENKDTKGLRVVVSLPVIHEGSTE